MNAFGKSLFCSGHNPTLEDVLREKWGKALAIIDGGSFQQRGDDLSGTTGPVDLSHFQITPLQLNVTEVSDQISEAEVDVSRRLDYGHRAKITGFRISKTLSFTGDKALWGLETNHPEREPPKAIIEGDRLVVGALVPKPEAQLAHEAIAATLEKIQRQLRFQEAQIERFNVSVAAEFAKRRHFPRSTIATSSGFPSAI